MTVWAKESGAKIIAVTDTPISPVGRIADLVLPAASAGAGMQNSMIAAMAVANSLLNGVAVVDAPGALERYGRLNRLMNQLDVFLLRSDEPE
jgi:DNA-binding MurR/RpiR family transcriptional regulator